MIQVAPELLLIFCEGKTEARYFSILKKHFRLPAWIKVIPDPDEGCRTLGQHESLINNAATRRDKFASELGIDAEVIETWAVCDRDQYPGSFSQLRQYAESKNIKLGFSDPQFENYLLQHFSLNKSRSRGPNVIQELSEKIGSALYKKGDLSWLEEMIDLKHSLVCTAATNAGNFSNHTKQPFFTVQNLVLRILSFEGE